MEIKNQVKFDMASGGAPIRIDAVQGELATRVLESSLYSGGVPLDLSGCVASVAYEKPDGTSGWYDKMPDGTSACEINGNAVSAKFAPQMVAVPGDVVAVIRIESSDGSQRAITFPFVVKVYEDPAADVEKSEDYYEVQNWDDVNSKFAEIEEFLKNAGTGINDEVISKESTWSSKNTVDKLCPAFEESGTLVTCWPVDGYPLEVVSAINDKGEAWAKISLTHNDQTYTAIFTNLENPVHFGSYNWCTGVLDDAENGLYQHNLEDDSFTEITDPVKYQPSIVRNIVGLPEANGLYSNCGNTTVKGLAYPKHIIGELTNEVESLRAEQNKQYELIEEVTLAEDVASFSRTADPNGVAYDFSAIRVYVKAPAKADLSGNGSTIFSIKDAKGSSVVYTWAASLSKTAETRTAFVAQNDCGMTYGTIFAGGTSALPLQSRAGDVVTVWKNIVNLGIAPQNNQVLPSGTYITIYAIRG